VRDEMNLKESDIVFDKVDPSKINADGSFEIPEGVTSIGDYAFEDCSGLM